MPKAKKYGYHINKKKRFKDSESIKTIWIDFFVIQRRYLPFDFDRIEFRMIE